MSPENRKHTLKGALILALCVVVGALLGRFIEYTINYGAEITLEASDLADSKRLGRGV